MRNLAVVTTILLVVSFAAWSSPAEAPPAARPASSAVVLDAACPWRIYHVLKPPTIQTDDGLKPFLTGKNWMNQETPEPPTGWTKGEFDDTAWLRATARSAAQTPCLSRLCLRGRFEVTEPAKVRDLQLTVAYYGGAVVYVNGREIMRSNVAAKAPQSAALAEDYAKDAFVGEDGKLLPSDYNVSKFPRNLAVRQRTIANLAIPADALQKGANVIAIEIVRAPYDKAVMLKKDLTPQTRPVKSPAPVCELGWNTCEFREVRLTAASADGLLLNTSRPAGMRAWNGDLLTCDYTSDLGDRAEALWPMAITGPRNGVFSGKVVLACGKSIAGLKATCTDLKQAAATIPASAVRIRYGFPWGGTSDNRGANAGRVIDGLLEAPLAEFPAEKSGGAVVPVWVTVKVPKDAKPGAYEGLLTIEAVGEKTVEVPVRLEVLDWTLGDTQDWRTWVELIESPDTLVAEYGVPFWSERHFAMMGSAMRYMSESGSRVVYVPLIAQANFGNEQSMVRWIKKGENQYDYDFSIMDKYLDLAEKKLGKPKIVCFVAWEVYLSPPKEEVVFKGGEDPTRNETAWLAARWAQRDKGPAVTLLDPTTGKAETVFLPRYEDPAAKALWQPLYAELRKRLEKRGLTGAAMLGMCSDYRPQKAEIAVLGELSGNMPWVCHTHGGSHANWKLYDIATLGYVAYVWDCKYVKDPENGRTYGWKRSDLTTQYARFGSLNVWPLSSEMLVGEMNIAGQQRGIGRIGADNWPPLKDKQGRRQGYPWSRYPQSLWHSMNMSSHMLVPGPDGPVSTNRYEAFREGIQQCEARIAIEKVLTDPALKAKLLPALAARCQELLDQRSRDGCLAGSGLAPHKPDYPVDDTSFLGGVAGNAWYVSTGWAQRAEDLYRLAAEVAAKAK